VCAARKECAGPAAVGGRGRGSCCCSLNGRALAGICVALRAGNVWTVPRQRCRLVVVGCSVQRRRAESHSLLRFVPRLVRKDCAAVSLRAVSSEFQRQGPALHRSAPLSWPCIWPQCAYANSPLQCRCWPPKPPNPAEPSTRRQRQAGGGGGTRWDGMGIMGWDEMGRLTSRAFLERARTESVPTDASNEQGEPEVARYHPESPIYKPSSPYPPGGRPNPAEAFPPLRSGGRPWPAMRRCRCRRRRPKGRAA
jgi:hypothetical protein